VNYAQDGGSLPGRVNTLTFRIEASGTGLESLEAQPTSGIEITEADPKEIAFGAPQEPLIVAVGDTIEVPFGLARRGGQPDAPVIVECDCRRMAEPSLGRPTGSTRLRWWLVTVIVLVGIGLLVKPTPAGAA
jgi:hypothetical protein